MNVLASLRDRDRIAAANLTVALSEPPNLEMDRLAEGLADESGCPMAGANIALKHGVRVVGSVGIKPWARRAPLATSICAYVAAQDEPVVLDQPRNQMPASCISARTVAFYAGVPIRVEGQVVGTCFAADTRPRTDGRQVLEVLTVGAARYRALVERRHRDLKSLTI